MTAPSIIAIIVAVLMLLWLTEWPASGRDEDVKAHHCFGFALALVTAAAGFVWTMASMQVQRWMVTAMLAVAFALILLGLRFLRVECVGVLRRDHHLIYPWQIGGYSSGGDVYCKRHYRQAKTPVDTADYPNP